MALVSIIMPAYNVSEFIALSIESVLNQTLQDWELLIVNDCSSDNTASIVGSYLCDSRLKLINNNVNLGGAASRNVAIEAAQGRYIAFLDADDLWVANKLEVQVRFMQENHISFSFTSYITMTEAGCLMDRIEVPKCVSFSKLLKHNYIGCLTAIYDAQPFGKIYMPLVRKRQDFALWLELLKRFDCAYGLNECLGFYRIRSGSLSASKTDALRFYWHVLRTVGGCNPVSASFYTMCYLFIVVLKKKQVSLYNRFFIS